MPYAIYGMGAVVGALLGLGAFPGLGVLVGLSMYLPFMYIATYGVGHALAARDPYRFWPLVVVGLLGKVLVPLGFVWAASRGQLPWELGLPVLALGALWWVPFGLIVRGAARAHRADQVHPGISPARGS